jgi:hypothetical protein
MALRWLASVCLGVATAFSVPLGAQSATVPPVLSEEALAALPLDSRFPTLLMQGRYLDAMEVVEAAAPAEVSEGIKSSYRQMRPALDGFHYVDPVAPQPREPGPALLAAYDGAVGRDAIETIVEQARDRRIVIVNEAHDSPRDRAFILKLAKALQPFGFTHYAAETFINQAPEMAATAMSRLERDGYPVRSTGYYTREPMFGYLVRRVLSLGYRPVSYEIAYNGGVAALSMEERIAIREQAQAENLARALAAAGPEAKFLVHVGYSHATERPRPPGETEWMAARLARLTGLDPLTIDQADVSEGGMAGMIRALGSRLEGGAAVFVRDGEPVRIGSNGEAVDLQVVHPLVKAVDGRPDWLRETGRKAVAIPAEFLPASGRRLVQAFVAGEAEDAVPLDQALVVAGQQPPVLYVPEGVEIRWAVQD